MTIDQRDKLSDVRLCMECLRGLINVATEPFFNKDARALSDDVFSRAREYNSIATLILSMASDALEAFDAVLDEIDQEEGAAV